MINTIADATITWENVFISNLFNKEIVATTSSLKAKQVIFVALNPEPVYYRFNNKADDRSLYTEDNVYLRKNGWIIMSLTCHTPFFVKSVEAQQDYILLRSENDCLSIPFDCCKQSAIFLEKGTIKIKDDKILANKGKS